MRFRRVTEPDPDRGDVDGAAVDELSLVAAGRDCSGLAELVDGASTTLRVLYAALSNLVERRWPPALAAPVGSAGDLACLARDRGLDAAGTQRGADRHRGIGLVRQDPVRAGSGTPRPGRSIRRLAITASNAIES